MSKEIVSYDEACKFDGKVLELRGYIEKDLCDVINIYDKDYFIQLCDIIKDTFEEYEDKLIQVMDGDLDILQGTFGYSEFTIICFYPEKMQLGGHDI